jgi:ABC-type oligopeptide transport system substrate-binding subunit
MKGAKKIMKKRIALLTVIVLSLISLSACKDTKGNVNAQNNTEEVLSGGWEVSDNNEITDELSKIFEKANETITGASYTPVLYLGSQVVAGKNHAFLCKMEPSVEELKSNPSWEIVYIYQDLEGNCTITKTDPLNIAN